MTALFLARAGLSNTLSGVKRLPQELGSLNTHSEIMTLFPQRFLRAAALACAITAGACAPASPSTVPAPSPAPAESPTRLEPVGWTAQSPAGPIAAWMREGCAGAPGGRAGCIERTLVALLDQVGVSRSMEVLDTLAAIDPQMRDEAHPLAHGLGISAYRGPETVAATFAACPTSQMSGCHHGVVPGYLLYLSARGRPIGTAELDGLCEPHRGRSFIHFQCAHGMGHGLMAVHGNHLPTALRACDQASDASVRESCYGGAFMENVVQATHPHHTAGGHAQTQGGAHGEHAPADAHGGAESHAEHGGGHAAHGAWKPLDRDDPLYPCNAVDPRYGDACYAMQTSPVMFFNGGDVQATARVCAGAPAAFRIRCFMSLGRDVSAWAAQDPARSAGMCRRIGGAADAREVTWCTRGVVETLVNQSADARDGIRFCRVVEGDEVKADCYHAVGGFMQMLVEGAEARGVQCAAAEPRFVAACRRGAGLRPRESDAR